MAYFITLAGRLSEWAGVDAATAGAGLGVVVASILVWLGHWISRANARLSASLQMNEKAAVVDLREIVWRERHGEHPELRFTLRNLGQTAATGVRVVAGRHEIAFAPVLGPTDETPVVVEIPARFQPSAIAVELRYRDYMGRRRRAGRTLTFPDDGGYPVQGSAKLGVAALFNRRPLSAHHRVSRAPERDGDGSRGN